MIDIKSLTIYSALDGLRSKQYTAVDLVRACLENIKKYNKYYNVLLTIEKENVLFDQANKIDSTNYSLPLAGVPIVLKDLFSTSALRTTAGSKVLEQYKPVYDATVVKKLKGAGAIIIGKANEDAWGHGSSGENSDFGPTRNPWDPSRAPGGSSSGSAVAVSLGIALAGTGTDTGSSVRLPAAFCNLVGVKPTYGRVSRYGIIAMASSFDSIGHITKTVSDNALLLEITAGKDQYDATTSDKSVFAYSKSVRDGSRNIKIGIPKEYMTKGLDKDTQSVLDESFSLLKKLGYKLQEISLPHTDVAMSCYYILVPSEVSSNLARYDGIRFGNSRTSFGNEAKRRIMTGTYTLSAGYYDAYYRTAAKVRTLIKQDFEEAFKNVDVIIAPSSPTLPFIIGEKIDPVQMYLSDIFMCPVNIAGMPSLNIPAGFAKGLPVGMQLIGPRWSEEKLYHIGYIYEQKTRWYEQIPKL